MYEFYEITNIVSKIAIFHNFALGIMVLQRFDASGLVGVGLRRLK